MANANAIVYWGGIVLALLGLIASFATVTAKSACIAITRMIATFRHATSEPLSADQKRGVGLESVIVGMWTIGMVLTCRAAWRTVAFLGMGREATDAQHSTDAAVRVTLEASALAIGRSMVGLTFTTIVVFGVVLVIGSILEHATPERQRVILQGHPERCGRGWRNALPGLWSARTHPQGGDRENQGSSQTTSLFGSGVEWASWTSAVVGYRARYARAWMQEECVSHVPTDKVT